MSEEWKPLSCQDRSCWHIRGPRGIYLSVNSEDAAREIAAKLILFDEMRAAFDRLATNVRGFLNADRQEHLRTRFSDDENDKFDKIVEALGPANAVLSRIDAINQKETP